MKRYFHTDLICESEGRLDNIEGTQYSSDAFGVCRVERLKIASQKSADKLGRKIGTYITLRTKKLSVPGDGENEALAFILGREIKKLLLEATSPSLFDSDFSVLVAGLGNSAITSDAIGPKTAERLTITRHIKELDFKLYQSLGMCSVSTILPGVLGKTGIESTEMINMTVKSIHPSAVIAIDALAARSTERLASTIQLSDSGISPGTGIGNFRKEISFDTLGVPVIAIGVPTVVDTATLIYDSLCDYFSESIPEELLKKLESMQSSFVTPKEADIIVDNASILIANALSEVFSISEDFASYDKYIN
jgi:spore protease